MNEVSSDGLDGFYPKSYNSKPISYLDLDICYGTAEQRNTYAYRMFSPCMYPDIAIRRRSKKCDDEDFVFCKTNPIKHIETFIP